MSKITWYVKENNSLTGKEEHHAGTFGKNDNLELEFQVWNNRWGVEEVDALKSPVLSFSFMHYEDSSLIDLCEIYVDGTSMPVMKKDGVGTVLLGREIKGLINDGDPDSSVNKQNYMNAKLVIKMSGKDIKENDLKRMYFEVKDLF